MTDEWLVLVESNTTGSGRLFCSSARHLGLRPVVLARDPARYPYLAADAIEHRATDTTSTPAVLAACHGLAEVAPIACVTSSSEYFIATAAEAARALGLPHPAPDAVRAAGTNRPSGSRSARPVFLARRSPPRAPRGGGRSRREARLPRRGQAGLRHRVDRGPAVPG